MTCQECLNRADGHVGIFNITCAGCRTAIALAEPCKLLRKSLVDYIEKRFGSTDNWKSEPHCGCERSCKRKANIKT